LNDIRYIVYKNFDQTQQEADTNFGLMLREGFLKENIDGEALLWGASRLMVRPEKRKLLFAISDGAPVDDSTLSVNRDDFLANHCKEIINQLRGRADVELYGIGIDCSVSNYYGRGSPALSSNAIGPDLLTVATLALEERWKESAGIQREPARPKQPRLTTGVTPRRRRVKGAKPPSSRVPGGKPLF
jgi:cobaltochelatase CobT subunit